MHLTYIFNFPVLQRELIVKNNSLSQNKLNLFSISRLLKIEIVCIKKKALKERDRWKQ